VKKEKLIRDLDGQLFAFEYSVVVSDPTSSDGDQRLAVSISFVKQSGDSDRVESYSFPLIPELLAVSEGGVDAIKENIETEILICKEALLSVARVLPYQGCLAFSRAFYIPTGTRFSDHSLDVLIERILALELFWPIYHKSILAGDGAGKCEAFIDLFVILANPFEKREAISLQQLKSRSEKTRKDLLGLKKKISQSFVGRLWLHDLVNIANEERGINSRLYQGDIVEANFLDLVEMLITRLESDLELYDSFSGDPVTCDYDRNLKKVERNWLQEEIEILKYYIESKGLNAAAISYINQLIRWYETRKLDLDMEINCSFGPPLDSSGFSRLSRFRGDIFTEKRIWGEKTVVDEVLRQHFLFYTGGPQPTLTASVWSVIFIDTPRGSNDVSKARSDRKK